MSVYNPVGLEDCIVFERLFFDYLNTDIKAVQSLSLVNQKIRNLVSSAITTMTKYALSPSFPIQFNFIANAWGVKENEKETTREQIIVLTCNNILRGEGSNQYILCLQEHSYDNPDFNKLLLLFKNN